MYCKSCASAIIFPIPNYAQLAPLSRCNHTASSSRNLTLPVQTTNFCAVLVLLLINVPTKPTQLAVDCEWNILYHNQVCLYDTDQNPRRNRGPTWCWSYHPVTFTMGSHIRYKARTNLFCIGNWSKSTEIYLLQVMKFIIDDQYIHMPTNPSCSGPES